jgi:hypothetical protein
LKEHVILNSAYFPRRQIHLRIQIESIFWFTVSVMFRFYDQGDYSVAVATKSQNKTSFVKDYLKGNPQAKSTAVNEAWTAAGMKGTISHTVVSEARKQLGLIGNQPGKTGKATKQKSASRMSMTASSPGKTMFVKEFLNDHPRSNVDAVNKAWRGAGFDGTISTTLVNKMRALMGLTGNLRGNTRTPKTGTTGKKRGRPRKETTAAANGKPTGQPRRSTSDRTDALLGVESEIDKLIFQVMGIGELPEIESVLREARRRVYGALSS